MKQFLILALLITGFIMVSCGDDDEPVDTGLVINLESPTDKSSFGPGDVMVIRGSVTDDVEVRSLFIEADGAFELPFTLTGVNSTILFNESTPVDSILNKGTYQLVVTATDDEGNSETESVEVTFE